MTGGSTRTASRSIRWRIGISLALVAFAVAGFNCSLVVDSNSEQCSSTEDCTSRGPLFAHSVCASHFCVTSATFDGGEGEGGVGKPGECKKNQDCLDKHPGEPWTCRKTDMACVKLTSAECPAYLADTPDLANDNAIIIGSILDRSGTSSPVGAGMEVAFNLARQEFRDAVSGLPPVSGGGRRPLVMVNCDENAAANSDPVKAATHLVDDLKVPVILGGFYSSTTIKVAQNVTIPNNVLLITPASTSPLVTGLPSANPRLVWRMVPSDVIQGDVVPAVTTTMISTLKSELGLTGTDKIKVAIVHRGDAAGSAIADVVISKLSFNGTAATAEANRNYFKEYNYGDPLADPSGSATKYTQFAGDMASSFLPHIVITAGSTTEVLDKIMDPVEKNWNQPGCSPTGTPRCYHPRYLLANSNFQAKALLDVIGRAANKSDLRHRILGHVAQTEGSNLNALKVRYQGVTEVPFVPLVPFAYDAFYATAYAITAVGNAPLTGPAIAEGLKKLLPPDSPIDVGLNKIPDALNALTNNRGIDFTGASGLLDFDPNTGDAPCDIQVWCVNENITGFNNSGLFYSAKAGSMQGIIDPSAKCP